MIVNKHKKISW